VVGALGCCCLAACELALGGIPGKVARSDAQSELDDGSMLGVGGDWDAGDAHTVGFYRPDTGSGEAHHGSDGDVFQTTDAASPDDGMDAAARDAGEPLDAHPPGHDSGAHGALDAGHHDASVPHDAGHDAGHCTPVTWYADQDGDTYGNDKQTESACSKPAGAWVQRGGDCADNENLVHPGQTNYFGTPFTLAGKDSFDFNCSGQEDAKPGQNAAPQCSGIMVLANCAGSGYNKTSRTGTGINAYCGSSTLTVCQGISLLCTGTNMATVYPFLCN
jgi:hypothetical protein